MRKLSLVIAGILGAGTPLISQAATLGEARVQSYLSQPLDVRVPLARSSDEPLDEITVKLAPPSFYREAGVPLENITGNLTFSIESVRGQDYVVIGSKRPIRDPILSILLEVDSPQGRMIREYNLLLDPPSIGSGQESRSEGATASNQPAAPASSARSSSPAASGWQRVEPAQDVSLDGTRDVQSGDTLYEIAREYVSDGADVRPLMQAIIDANPQAFANGNGNALMAGARLRVPDTGASATSDDQADTDGSTSDTATVTERLPALELLGPEEDGEQTATAPANVGGFGELTREKPLAAISDGTQQTASTQTNREAALDQEEVESVRAENEALTEQLRALKDQIDTVKVAVDERDAQIAELQKVIEQSQAELESAERAAGNFWMEWGKYLTGALGLVIIALLIALALRRNRRDEEPGVAMPVTSDTSNKRSVERDPVAEPALTDTTASPVAGSAAAATAASGAAYAISESEPEEPTPGSTGGMDDPMNPEMALEEARVLESFNLTHQAVELLQDSLAEHPGHSGLQAAVNRLKGIDTGATTDESRPQSQDDDFTPMVATDDADESADEATTSREASPEPIVPTDNASESTDDWEADQQQAPAEVDWDDDLDDMLATPEPESRTLEDEQSMDLDDSFALETPQKEEGTTHQVEETTPKDEENELELPENEAPPASVDTPASETDEPEALDLDLSGYEPAGERDEPVVSSDQDEGMDLDLGENEVADKPVESDATAEEPADQTASAADNEADVDTRVGLAEAFLDVGDRESFDMIEAELREEGATAALERLEELKKRHTG